MEGNFLNKNNSGDVEIFGTLIVDGDFTNGTGSGMGAVIDVGSTGTITVGGTCDNPGTVSDGSGSYSGDCDNPVLPVELLNFRAVATEFGNLLQWETASERDNDFFEIQRIGNGRDFETIDQISGNGNSDRLISYRFVDSNPLPGRSFYRLKQVDFDGAFEFSYIVSVITGQLPNFQVQQIYPIPTNKDINLSYITNNDDPVFYELFDELGKVILSGEIYNQFGSNTVTLKIPQLLKGVYFLSLANRQIKTTSKVIIIG